MVHLLLQSTTSPLTQMYLYGAKVILDKAADKLAYLSCLELIERYIRYSSLVDLPTLGP